MMALGPLPAAQSAVIYHNTADFTYTLSDSSGADATGSFALPTAASYDLDEHREDGDSTADFDGLVDATVGGPVLAIEHQNAGSLPNFPVAPHSLETVFTQTLRFVAESGDGDLTLTGTLSAAPTPGLTGDAAISLVLRDLTDAVNLFEVEVNNEIHDLAGTTPPVTLIAGHHYEIVYRSGNDFSSSDSTFGGSIATGGTLIYSLDPTASWEYDESAVPEPSFAALAVMTLGFGLARRRRRG